MTLLVLGLILWSAAHFLGIFAPGSRANLSAGLGAGPARGLVTLSIVGAVVLMVIGYQRAEIVDLWYPPSAMFHINNLLMLFAVFLFIAGRVPSPVRRRMRHPQLTGVKVWALAHLLVNGDLASVVLFGGLLAWAVLSVIGINRRDKERGDLPEVDPRGLVVHVALTVIVVAVIVFVHGMLLGVWTFPA